MSKLALLSFAFVITVLSGTTLASPDQYYPKDTPFEILDCEAAFNGLKPQEKRYAHYISRASWDGHFITLFQTSPESPLIFIFFDKVLRSKPSLPEVKAYLKQSHAFTDDEVAAFFVYAGAFLSNGGNYRGYGDTKFVPEVPSEKMEALLKTTFPDDSDFYLEHCLKPMYDYNPIVRRLGFPPRGVTTYWSSNCNDTDVPIVAAYLKEKRLDAYNQRVFKEVKNGKTSYEIRFASQQLSNEPDTTYEKLLNHDEVRNGVEFRFRRGDYSSIIPDVIKNLELAQKEAANDNERRMLKEYVNYFKTGSLEAHKEGSRYWIKDKGPAVESYIGFIENYRDPAGARAEYEGFVAVVNREGSKRLGQLVGKAEQIIKDSMPWPREFEKDTYLKPDFTALDVITFSGSSVPSGINIPNYDEIRQNEGFKNVNLQNVGKSVPSNISFVTESDAALIKKYKNPAFEVQVGLHELLGHGSGKLFQKIPGDGLNFNESTLNPLTGKPVTSYYAEGESFDSVFGTMGSSYEECRAESIGLYLSLKTEVLEIFRHTERQEQEDITYVNWLDMVLSGIGGLAQYDINTKKWGQAHSQARHVILRVLLESAPGLVTIKEIINSKDQKADLLISLNRDEIQNSGKKAIQDFLVKLQVYKSTADITGAKKMYLGYSNVELGSEMARWRDVVIARQKPRKVIVQSNTRINISTNEVELLTYPNTSEGFAQSWIDRYANPTTLHKSLRKLYEKDLEHSLLKQDYYNSYVTLYLNEK